MHIQWPEAYDAIYHCVQESGCVATCICPLRIAWTTCKWQRTAVHLRRVCRVMRNNGVKQIRSAPYHPASNSLVERFVQSLKTALKRSKQDGRSLSNQLASFLFTYQTSPHATTGVSQSSLFHQRNIWSHLSDLIRSPLFLTNSLSKGLVMTVEERIEHISRDSQSWHEISLAVIIERLGPLSYLVETDKLDLWRHHVDQLKEIDITHLKLDWSRMTIHSQKLICLYP